MEAALDKHRKACDKRAVSAYWNNYVGYDDDD